MANYRFTLSRTQILTQKHTTTSTKSCNDEVECNMESHNAINAKRILEHLLL
ncbi:hypothetical protein [Helicobacter rodentium]|uniref:hypothetical protein n=1 Tax=Helicobacter rodentium TaxID=59617 RepID=UPI000B1AC767|nr:hypothetical protein [Helicobacter rodentium]